MGNSNTHSLIRAVEGGDLTRVQEIVSSEAEKWEEVKDKDGNGLLHIAARKNRPKIAQYLIENRIDIELRNKLNETPFLVAVKHGHAVVVGLLLSKGCNRLAESKWSRGALGVAICNRQFEMTKKLVEMGFDVDRPSEEYGYTSMHYAALRGNIQIANYLIDSGANLEAQSKSGITPILATFGTNNVGLFDMLISRGCNVKAKEECGHGALARASAFGRINMVKKLIEMGFDVNEACSHGRTSLHWTVECDDASIAALLIKHGANIEARDIWGRTPFLRAVCLGSNNVAGLLVSKGCNLHAKDEDGHGAFVLACTRCRFDTAKLLLSKFDYMKEEGASMLHWAAHNDYQRMAVLLISNGANLEAKDEWGCTPFLTAVEFGSDNTIDLLISKKCNIFAKTRDGASALDLAITGGRLDLLRRLVNAGVDVNYLTQETRDFLAKLVADGNKEASKYFKEMKALLYALQEKDVVLTEPELKSDSLRDDFSTALEPETNNVAAVDGGKGDQAFVSKASESPQREQDAFAVSSCTENSCIVQ